MAGPSQEGMRVSDDKEIDMSDEVELKEESVVEKQVTEEKLVWSQAQTLGVPSTVYRADLATVKVGDLPIPAVLADCTQASVVGEFFDFIYKLEVTEAVILNAMPVDTSASPTGTGIDRRNQYFTAAMDSLTGRYEILNFKVHQVRFDRNMAIANHVKVTYANGRWTAWDWYKGLGRFQMDTGPLPRRFLNKHNSLVAILTGQAITIPTGKDMGYVSWVKDAMDIPLKQFIEERDERFAMLRDMQEAYTASTNAMYRHKNDITLEDLNLEPGIYKVIDRNGRKGADRTYNPEKPYIVGLFSRLAQQGYSFEKVADL